MNFRKICVLANGYTSLYITNYKKLFYDDGELDKYIVTFKNGYVLDLDRDDITEEDLKKLIANKTDISIHFNLEVAEELGEAEGKQVEDYIVKQLAKGKKTKIGILNKEK